MELASVREKLDLRATGTCLLRILWLPCWRAWMVLFNDDRIVPVYSLRRLSLRAERLWCYASMMQFHHKSLHSDLSVMFCNMHYQLRAQQGQIVVLGQYYMHDGLLSCFQTLCP